jgi:hypothetical protein
LFRVVARFICSYLEAGNPSAKSQAFKLRIGGSPRVAARGYLPEFEDVYSCR